ncbi:MAG: PTS transporter subunit EIIB [Candidatus Methanomethylophilus sp.]|nr:PTS transporter subunit EIIB [Bacteroidales bacterium]MBO5599956.1 PTS transporter subunit EIIB [Methanomethylophilus sp.]
MVDHCCTRLRVTLQSPF